MIRTFAVVNFSCPKCGSEVTEGIDGIVFHQGLGSDSTVIDLPETCQCHRCQSIYGIEVETLIAPWTAKVSGYPDVKVRFYDANDDREDLWLDSTPPDDPFRVLMDSYHRLNDIVAEYGSGGNSALPHLTDSVNRMVFAGAVSAMEAFLADVLIRTVLIEEFALKRLLESESELKKMTSSLVDIHSNPQIVYKKTQDYLSKLLYHNIEKVFALYLIAFKFEIFPSKDLRKLLHRAVKIRHDIVHRNGKNLEGEYVELKQEDVVGILEGIKELAAHVDNNVTNAIFHGSRYA